MQPMESMGPGQLIMPSPQSMGGICGQKNGHSSPSAMQISGIMHPMGSMSPGQVIMPSPQSMGGICGQKNGHSSPSSTHISGIMHPMGSMSPGQWRGGEDQERHLEAHSARQVSPC